MSACILIFFAMVMLFQKEGTATELQFVRNSDETTTHNAANQRDYLFQNEAGNPEYQWQITQWQEPWVEPTWPAESIDSLINPDEAEQIITATTGTNFSGTAQTGTIYSWTIMTGTQTTGTTIPTKTGSLDCITPRKEVIKNNDFVLAYQQRKDVNTICNIEKRVCTNWVLWWTFEQHSCKEDVVYVYQKAEVISYNQKVLNEYIQPNAPVNEWADFNNEGKINTTETATNSRWTTNNPVTTKPTTNQTQTTKANCTTPRGQTVKHGQFVKAYKSSRGFIDAPCEVEIRACVNGKMKGTFVNPSCTFNNTSYTEYLKAGSPATNTGFLFFERIKKIVKFGK